MQIPQRGRWFQNDLNVFLTSGNSSETAKQLTHEAFDGWGDPHKLSILLFVRCNYSGGTNIGLSGDHKVSKKRIAWFDSIISLMVEKYFGLQSST